MAFTIERVDSGDALDEVRRLMRDFRRSLTGRVEFPGFSDEIQNLPGKYQRPTGTLLLLRHDGFPAGCVGLRRIDEQTCEMKRLFVRPQYRGLQGGKLLVEKLLDEARELGYSRMYLDTVPSHAQPAVALYRSMGFREIPPYNDYAPPESIFMAYELAPAGRDARSA